MRAYTPTAFAPSLTNSPHSQLIKKYKRGDIPSVDWLDKLANRQASQVYQAELEASPNLFLYIEMPQFELPVVFCEPEPKPITLPPLHTHQSGAAGTSAAVPAAAVPGTLRHGAPAIDASLFTIVDPEIARDNPIEAKYRRMARNHRSDPLDQEMKPSADVRDQLNVSVPRRVMTASRSQSFTLAGNHGVPTDTRAHRR